MIDSREEQIRMLARQLKIPTFGNYSDILRQCKSDADFSDLLLELMLAESASRQENQTKRRLKVAGFPFQKTLDEFDMSQLNDSVSPVFLRELASCKFIQERKNIVMIGNPGRGNNLLCQRLFQLHELRQQIICLFRSLIFIEEPGEGE